MVLGHSAEPRAHCHDHKRLHSVQECVPGGPWGGGEGNEEEGREMGRRGGKWGGGGREKGVKVTLRLDQHVLKEE